MPLGIVRVDFDGTPEVTLGDIEVSRVETLRVEHAAQEGQVGIRIDAARTLEALAICRSHVCFYLLCNIQRDACLQDIDIPQAVLEISRPHAAILPRVEELHGNAHVVARPCDRSFNDLADSQGFADFRKRCI